MKQIIFVLKRERSDLPAFVANMALRGLLSQCRGSGAQLAMSDRTSEWLRTEATVEVQEIEDIEVLAHLGLKATTANLCPYVNYLDEARLLHDAISIGPFSQGVFNSVLGDVARFSALSNSE